MGFMDLNKVSKSELVAQFIIERRGRGLFLSYPDYQLIGSWLKASENDVEKVIFILSQLLQVQAGSSQSQKTNFSLKIFDKQVRDHLRHIQNKIC
jgi:hypothetical protein